MLGGRVVRAVRGELTPPHRSQREHESEHDRADSGEPGVALDALEAQRMRAPARAPRQTARGAGEEIDRREDERQAQDRFPFVGVAQRGAGAVEEILHRTGKGEGGGDPVGARDRVGRRQQEQSYPGDEGETAAMGDRAVFGPRGGTPLGRARPGKPDKTGAGDDDRGDDYQRGRDDLFVGADVRGDVRHPAARAAEHLDERGPAGGHPGGFDVVEERRRDAAEHEQRHDPPDAHECGEADPPAGEATPRAVRSGGE